VDDWAEYHAKYEFSDGAFTAERHLLVKKDKVPLSDWDKYLDFRRGIYADEERTEPILHAGFTDPGSSSTVMELGPSNVLRQIFLDILPLRDVVTVLFSDEAKTSDNVAKIVTDAQTTLDLVESESASAPQTEPNSLYWSQGLATSWCVRGWAALAANDIPTAGTYLRAAWRLGQNQLCGYLLGRVLEVKGDKAAAAQQYELAHITSGHTFFGGFSPEDDEIRKRIDDGYKRVTGKTITATPLNHGSYEGSLEAELDKLNEIHQIAKATKLTGEALYVAAFTEGAPAKVSMISGDPGFRAFIPVFEARGFPQFMPTGSKAKLLREMRIICSPWSGCDAYQLLPGSIQMPRQEIHVKAIQVPVTNVPKGSKTIP
jgi:hypothetical protein